MKIRIERHSQKELSKLSKSFQAHDAAKLQALDQMASLWNALSASKKGMMAETRMATSVIMDELERMIDVELEAFNAEFDKALKALSPSPQETRAVVLLFRESRPERSKKAVKKSSKKAA